MAEDAQAGTALVIVDVLNPYEHEDSEPLADSMAAVVPRIAGLIERARDARQPVVYVNDNYGNWNSSSRKLLDAALAGRHPELVEPLRPPEDAMFVIKARHSIFFQTPLEYLLRQVGVPRIMLVGQVTEQCILYSALDAYVRHLRVAVPSDAVACIDRELHDAALEMMRRNMRADVQASADCAF